MVTNVVMPKAGLTMIEGTITVWIAAEGAQVKKGDNIMELENEKNTITSEALGNGFLHIISQVGETIPIGETIGYLAETKAEYDALVAGSSAEETETEKGCARECETCVHQTEPQVMPAVVGAVTDGRVRASGLARKMAVEAGINLAEIPAPSGRVQRRDVAAYLKTPKVVAEPVDDNSDVVTEIPWVGIKKTIANNMFNSQKGTAQCTCMQEVDVTKLLALRQDLVANAEKLGCRISVNDILCKMLGKVLKKHPLANATFDGKTLYTHKHVHLSVAVATDHGLFVPVVKNIDTLSLTEVHHKIKALVQQAKEKSLPLNAQTGGTCMITNFGVYPVDFATPILYAPQTCIVGFGRPKLKPVALPDGTLTVRQMMYVVFTLDHQVIDGKEVGSIFGDIQAYMENPEMILV